MKWTVLIIFIVTSLFGACVSMLMMDNQMAGCPLMNEPLGICQMSPLEHIYRWQKLFPTNLISLFLVLITAISTLVPNALQSFIINRFHPKRIIIFSAPTVEILRI